MNKMSTRIARLGIILLILTLGLPACGIGGNSAPALTPVTMQHFWVHGTLFAGFYAAEQNGYYAEEGLAVTLVESEVDTDYLGPVTNGTAQFGVAGADELLLARAEGKPLKAIATIYRRSPSVFVALTESGITEPRDFVGKTVRITPQAAAHFHAMMERAGISRDQYNEVALPSDLELFASGQADVWNLYINNFGVELQQAGYKLNYIYPDDYGVHFYADTLFTTDDLIAENPDLVLRFVRATLKGWAWAVEHPDEVSALVLKYKPDADVDLEISRMTASIPLVNTGEDYIGWMKPEVWAGMEQTLREQSVLTNPLDVKQVYTMQFLEEIYGK